MKKIRRFILSAFFICTALGLFPLSAAAASKAPSAPTDLKVYQTGSKTVYLSWTRASDADGYVVYQRNPSGKFKKIAATTNRLYTVTGLPNNVTYKFKVRSYSVIDGKVVYSQRYSSVVSARPTKPSSAVSAIHPMWFKATVNADVTASPANSKSQKQTVKKGTKVTVQYRSDLCKVQLPNGQLVYIPYSKLTFTSTVYTKKEYKQSVKEEFVNHRGYSSQTKYLIWINTYTQSYNLFVGSTGNWKLYRTAKVATGKVDNPSSPRVCRITKKAERWNYPEGRYVAPVVYYFSDNAFHSRMHRPDGSIEDTRIGQPVSAGCIRMYDEDIQYIYKYCPIGTTVVIY